jgi:hypothetical protein
MLTALEKKIASENRRAKVLQELSHTLLHELLSGNIRVPMNEVEAHA